MRYSPSGEKRMKVVIIAEVPDYVDLKFVNEHKEVVNKNYNGYRMMVVHPMPSKRETQVHWKSIGGEVNTHEPSEYDKGWNDCVSFMEGEYDG